MSNSAPSVSAEIMLVAATFDPSCRPFFYKNICDSEIFAGISRSSLPHLSPPKYAALHKDGKSYLAVFTEEKMVPPPFDRVKMKLRDFLVLSAAKGIAMNPGQPVSKEFSEEELTALLSGELTHPKSLWRAARPPVPVLPPRFSEQYKAPLQMLLADHPCVEYAWLGDLPASASGVERGTWVGLSSSEDSACTEAAAECAIMLATSDVAPSSFGVQLLGDTPTPPPSAKIIHGIKGGRRE